MTSARSITAAVNPPRAAFLDFPLGHTTGKPLDAVLQRQILLSALECFASLTTPGQIVDLPYEWAADDSWKDGVMRPQEDDTPGGSDAGADDRVARHATPQYQTSADEAAARDAGTCPTCVFLE